MLIPSRPFFVTSHFTWSLSPENLLNRVDAFRVGTPLVINGASWSQVIVEDLSSQYFNTVFTMVPYSYVIVEGLSSQYFNTVLNMVPYSYVVVEDLSYVYGVVSWSLQSRRMWRCAEGGLGKTGGRWGGRYCRVLTLLSMDG